MLVCACSELWQLWIGILSHRNKDLTAVRRGMSRTISSRNPATATAEAKALAKAEAQPKLKANATATSSS